MFYTFPNLISGCSGNAPVFDDNLQNQQVTLPLTSPNTYTFGMASQCQALGLVMSWSVDKYSTIPSFLTMTSTTLDNTLSMNPTDSDAGTYTIRVTFSVIGLPSLYTSQTFLLDVFPSTSANYTAPTITTSCGSNIYPMVLGSSVSYLNI